MGKASGRSDRRIAVCETCGAAFHPIYNSKGRFCGYSCSRAGSVRLPREQIRRLYLEERREPPEVAEALGLTLSQVYQAVHHMGISRTRSEALTLWHANAGAESRKERAQAANDAVRNVPVTLEAKRRTAATNHRREGIVGPHEVVFADMLRRRGIGFDQQTPCEGYNIDFTLTEFPVAVEIVTGGGSNGHWEYLHQRRIDCLHHWHVFEVKFRKGRRVLAEPVIDKLIAFAEKVSTHPSPFGQYRMVWPDGQEIRTNRRTRLYEVRGS